MVEPMFNDLQSVIKSDRRKESNGAGTRITYIFSMYISLMINEEDSEQVATNHLRSSLSHFK